MLQNPTVSIIICTHNNAHSLVKTLCAFGLIDIPEDWTVELIVVDNASTDETSSTVKDVNLPFEVCYVFEPDKGLSNARNTGLNASRSDVILFTDDDVIPCRQWIRKMALPLLNRECDGITGRIQLSEDLIRPWMKPMHKIWLAAAGVVRAELVGACMGFHKSVLEMVPRFDSELGAGASGFAEETLFSDQLRAAGYQLCAIEDQCVKHCPSVLRLIRREWLASAKKRGRSSAYILHHWKHGELRYPRLIVLYFQIKLWIRRIIQPPSRLDEEGCPEWELSYVVEIEKHLGFLKERNRSRNYEKNGLKKII